MSLDVAYIHHREKGWLIPGRYSDQGLGCTFVSSPLHATAYTSDKTIEMEMDRLKRGGHDMKEFTVRRFIMVEVGSLTVTEAL